MHEDDRQRIETVGAQPLQLVSRRALVQRTEDRPVAGDTLGHLYHPLRQLLGQHDVAREDVRPGLRADPQRVAEARGNGQRQPFAFAFEQGIGGDRGADAQLGDRPVAKTREQTAHALAGSVRIKAGTFGQQLFGD